MKLLLITAIVEFEKEVKRILKKAKVETYSYKEVVGYKNVSEDAMESNWFGAEMTKNESIMFYVFVEKENVDAVLTDVTAFNLMQESSSHIHVAVLNIEKLN